MIYKLPAYITSWKRRHHRTAPSSVSFSHGRLTNYRHSVKSTKVYSCLEDTVVFLDDAQAKYEDIIEVHLHQSRFLKEAIFYHIYGSDISYTSWLFHMLETIQSLPSPDTNFSNQQRIIGEIDFYLNRCLR